MRQSTIDFGRISHIFPSLFVGLVVWGVREILDFSGRRLLDLLGDFVFCAMLGSVADTCIASVTVYVLFWSLVSDSHLFVVA